MQQEAAIGIEKTRFVPLEESRGIKAFEGVNVLPMLVLHVGAGSVSVESYFKPTREMAHEAERIAGVLQKAGLDPARVVTPLQICTLYTGYEGEQVYVDYQYELLEEDERYELNMAMVAMFMEGVL